MTVVVNTRDDITLANYRRVAYGAEGVQIGRRARGSMQARWSGVMSSPASAAVGSQSTPDRAQVECAQLRLIPAEAAALPSSRDGFLDEAVVRGIVFARFTNIVAGQAPVRPAVFEGVAALLDGQLPPVPIDGQAGPGEWRPLSYVLGGLAGADLEPAERAALLGGSPCSAALVADAAIRARNRLEHAEAIFALSIEAFRAPLGAYDAALDDLFGDIHEAAALRSLRAYVEGVALEGRRFHQAPVSYRIIPRVLGQGHRAVAAVEKAASISLRSVTDDAGHVSPDDRRPTGCPALTGGAHNAIAYPALNAMTATWADVALLAERHVTALNTADTSELPVNLGVPGLPRSGTYAYGWAASSFVEEARAAAVPALLPASAGGPYDDIVSPTFSAYGRERRAAECLDGALTILALVSSQALCVTDRTPPNGLRPLLGFVRSVFPPVLELGERNLSAEAAQLQRALGEAAITGTLAAP